MASSFCTPLGKGEACLGLSRLANVYTSSKMLKRPLCIKENHCNTPKTELRALGLHRGEDSRSHRQRTMFASLQLEGSTKAGELEMSQPSPVMKLASVISFAAFLTTPCLEKTSSSLLNVFRPCFFRLWKTKHRQLLLHRARLDSMASRRPCSGCCSPPRLPFSHSQSWWLVQCTGTN